MVAAVIVTDVWAQETAPAVTPAPLPQPAPVFSPSPSPLPQFLLSPSSAPPAERKELITDPSRTPKPAPKKKKPPVIAKPVLKTKDVDKVEDLSGPQVFMEDTRGFVADSMVNLSNRIDSFLGSKRADDELNRSSLRLAYSYRLRDTYSGDDDREVRFNLRLPGIDKRLKELSFRDAPTKAELKKLKEKKKREREPWRFRTDVGFNAAIPRPQAFTRARIRKNWIFANWIPRFEEELGYFTDRGLVNAAYLNTDREIQKNEQLLRFVNETEWRITQKRFTTSHGPSVIHNTSDDDVWSYNARLSTFRENEGEIGSYFLSGYGLSITYRRNLQGQWLYGEITPALDWPKVRGFRRTPGIALKLESLFGRR